MNEETKVMAETSVKYQCLATLVVSMISTGFGLNLGWAGTSILLLTSDETPFKSGKITMEEASWIVALLPLGSCMGNVFYGCIIKTQGRKWPLFYISIPMILSWVLVYFPENIYYLYVARLLHGFVAGGVVIVVTTYIIEISNDSIRGTLGSTVTLCGNMGIMLMFVMGTYCDYYTAPLIIIASTVLYATIFIFFPETPTFLMKQNKVSDAEKSTRFYQNLRNVKDCELLEVEMKKLKSVVGGGEMKECKKTMEWSDLTTGPGRKAMIVGMVLCALNQLSGCFAIVNYSGIIFKESGSNLSPNESMIFVSIIQFFGSIVLLFLIDRAGRKFLYSVSTIGAAFGLIVLGTYMMLKTWHWHVEAYRRKAEATNKS